MDHKELKFLVNVGVGKKVEQWLQKRGYDWRAFGSVRGVMQKGEVMVFPICWQIQKRRESHDQEEEYHK